MMGRGIQTAMIFGVANNSDRTSASRDFKFDLNSIELSYQLPVLSKKHQHSRHILTTPLLQTTSKCFVANQPRSSWTRTTSHDTMNPSNSARKNNFKPPSSRKRHSKDLAAGNQPIRTHEVAGRRSREF